MIKSLWSHYWVPQTHLRDPVGGNYKMYFLIRRAHNTGENKELRIGCNAPMEPPVPHPCPRICVISQSVSAIYHLGLWVLIKPERLCCCSSYGRLLLFYLAVRSLRLFITNRATALYECPQAQHHTVFWYSAATVLVCHYKRQCWTIKGRKIFRGHCHISSANTALNNKQQTACGTINTQVSSCVLCSRSVSYI